MTDDVVIETVYRVKNRRTGYVTLHDSMNSAQGAVREAVFIAEVLRLLAMQVDGATAKMLLTQSRAFIRLLAQYDEGFLPVAAGVGICAAQDGSGDISIYIHGLACPHCGAGRGDLHGLECPHRAHLAELPLQGTADEAAGLAGVPGVDAVSAEHTDIGAQVSVEPKGKHAAVGVCCGCGSPIGVPHGIACPTQNRT